MAEIVKACDTSLRSRPLVAVKRILPHLCEDEQYKTMFLDESRVLTQLDHPNVIHAFEVGEIEGTPYIALDFVDGQDARSLFQRVRGGDERVPVSIACFVIASVCDGLHHAHEQKDQHGQSLRLVHRDVSLQNILLSYAGDVKLTDFGIAVSSQNVARTEAGIVKGKFGYMSPEQIKGAPLDRRSDVFGAGICLYELLTGERLFAGDNDYKAIERVRNVDIEPPSVWNRAIPSGLEKIVLKALAKNPRDRFASALSLRQALLAFMAASGSRCSRDDLGRYLRTVFADVYEATRESPAPHEPAPAAARARQGTAPHALGVRGGARESVAVVPGPNIDDETTGLMAFDHLDPVSALHFASGDPDAGDATPQGAGAAIPSLRKVQATLPPAGLLSPPRVPDMPEEPRDLPIVPPIVPHPDSVPGTLRATELFGDTTPAHPGQDEPSSPAQAAVPEPRPLMMDWDEHEPTTISKGFEHVKPLPDPFDTDDEVTRLRFDEAPSSPVAALQSGPFPPTLEVPQQPAAPQPPIRQSALPTISWPAARQAVWPERLKRIGAVVAGLLALALIVYLVGDRGPATLRLTTEPADAAVTVNGKPARGSASPYVLSELDPSIEHTILVEKQGYRGWSTTLRLRAEQVLDLPLVKLEPIEPPLAAQPLVIPVVEDVPADEPPAPVASPPPRAPRTRSASGASRASRRRQRAERKAAAEEPAADAEPKPRASAASSAASSGKLGSLRINTRPWSRVLVNGRLIGNTPQLSIQLPAGTHKVSLVNPEFGIRKELTIRIKAGEVVTRVLNLQE